MPFANDASDSGAPVPQAAPALPAAAAFQLAQACRALWIATLSLMVAFMHTAAPAHRYLLACRIARNFETLAGQECFDCRSRASFGGLARTWQAKAARFAPDREQATSGRGRGLLRLLFRAS